MTNPIKDFLTSLEMRRKEVQQKRKESYEGTLRGLEDVAAKIARKKKESEDAPKNRQ